MPLGLGPDDRNRRGRRRPLRWDARHLELLDAFLEQFEPGPRVRLSQRVQMLGTEARVAECPPTPGLEKAELPAEGRRWRFADPLDPSASGLSVHPELPQIALTRRVGIGVKGVGSLEILDAVSGATLVERELRHLPWCVAYSPDGRTLARRRHRQRSRSPV